MVNHIKNKKNAQTTYSEIALIVISILVVGASLFFSSKSLIDSEDNLDNSLNDLSYNFPSLYINTFLNLKIQKNDSIKLNLNENETYYIKDLIYLNSEQSNKIINKYKNNYINSKINKDNKNNGMNNLFKLFSNTEYETTTENLLVVNYIDSLDSLDKLSDEIKNKNYYYYIKTIDNKYGVIKFRN